MTTITRRISGLASGGATKRVAFGGHEASYDVWAESWGGSWALTWYVNATAAELPAITQRVKFHHVLSLEGDEAGVLLLEGDEEGGLGLEGDSSFEISDTHTKRVTLQ